MHGNHDHSSHAPKRGEAEQTYTCPMHPEIRQAGPGRCPLGGMALVPVKAGQVVRPKQEKEYDKHAGHKTSSFLAKFWLEAARKVNVALFDKTGTLTKGAFGVDSVVPNANYTRERVLQMAASVNSASEHPLAKALVEEAQKEGLSLLAVKDFERLPGKGTRAEVEGREVRVGNDALLNETGTSAPLEHQSQIAQLSGQGKTVIHVMADGQLLGSIALAQETLKQSRDTRF